jgi:hypothetical protein
MNLTNVLSKIHPLFILNIDFNVKKYSLWAGLKEGGRIIFAVPVLVLI